MKTKTRKTMMQINQLMKRVEPSLKGDCKILISIVNDRSNIFFTLGNKERAKTRMKKLMSKKKRAILLLASLRASS